MEKSLANFRFALWGILGAFLIYVGYWVYNAIQVSGSVIYRANLYVFTQRVAIIASILLVELIVYWLIRRRLYYKSWVRIHIGLLWLSMVILPAVFLIVFYYLRYTESPVPYAEVSHTVGAVFGLVFLISILTGHLFFILTIVKSFSKKKRLQTNPDANDSPHILDEFNQQSAGL